MKAHDPMVPSRHATTVYDEVPETVERFCGYCNRFYWDDGRTTQHFCQPSRGVMCECGEWPRDVQHEHSD